MLASVRRSVKDVDVEAEVDPAAEDLKTMGGPIAQDLLPLPRHSVFSVREPRSQCRNPGKGRMSTRLLSARFSAHADPDSVWTSSLALPSPPRASLLPRFVSPFPRRPAVSFSIDPYSAAGAAIAIARKFRRRTCSM